MSEEIKPKKEKFDIARELFDWAQALVHAIVSIVLLFAFALSMYTVKGPSMENTLHAGEMLIISNLFYTPQRGDIVIFTKYGHERAYDAETGRYEPFVKRVVGLPGDTIDIANGHVTIMGQGDSEPHVLDEPYILETMRSKGDITYPITVPEGQLFVMGDNRNDSLDSRTASVGMIDRRLLLGRVLFRLLPFSKFGTIA